MDGILVIPIQPSQYVRFKGVFMKEISDEEIIEMYINKVKPTALEKFALTFGFYWASLVTIPETVNHNLPLLKGLPLISFLPSFLKHFWAIFTNDNLFTLFLRTGLGGQATIKAYCPKNFIFKLIYYIGWIAPVLSTLICWNNKFR